MIVLCNNRRFRSYPVSALQQQTIQKVGIFPLFLIFYSITISRVLKITLECRFIDDFSQTEIDLVLKTRNILCVASINEILYTEILVLTHVKVNTVASSFLTEMVLSYLKSYFTID